MAMDRSGQRIGQSPEKPSALSRLLSPFAVLYGRWQIRKLHTQGVRVAVPVVAMDALSPDADRVLAMIAMVQAAQTLGHSPAVLWHGSQHAAVAWVDPRVHSAAEVGDAALLLAAFVPVWVGSDPVDMAQNAVADGADILLRDGGILDPTLCADMSILINDAARGFGNGLCWPAGPLRLPLDAGLARADALLSIGAESAQTRFHAQWSAQIQIPHLTAGYSVLQTGMDWQGMPVLAFAGIARPEIFFAHLRTMGAHVIRAEALSPHQHLTSALLNRLEASATMSGAQLVTTEQDAVRLPARFRQKVLTVPIRLSVNENGALHDLLRAKTMS